MDFATAPQERGHPMSRYIATTLLAIAAAVITVAELAIAVDQPGHASAALMVRP